jgi:shikimate dehydrogenase
MHDTVGQSPVSSSAFKGTTCAVDLIYNPAQSEFLRQAKEQGLRTINGEAMLFYQAYYADCLYLGEEANEQEAKKLYEQFYLEIGRDNL